VNLTHPRGAHYGRFLLAIGEPVGPPAIRVNSREAFAVAIEHGYLPVAVLAAPIRTETRAALLCFCTRFCFYCCRGFYVSLRQSILRRDS